jgi:hypothetical protein
MIAALLSGGQGGEDLVGLPLKIPAAPAPCKAVVYEELLPFPLPKDGLPLMLPRLATTPARFTFMILIFFMLHSPKTVYS